MLELFTIIYVNEEEILNIVILLEFFLFWKIFFYYFNIEIYDVVINSELFNGELFKVMELVGIVVEFFFLWRNFLRDFISFFILFVYFDDSVLVVVEVFTWVNNFSYSYLKESGFFYVSFEMILILVFRYMYILVFDVFKTD